MVSPRPYKLDVWEWIVKRRIFDPFSVFFPPDVFSSLLIYKVTARDAMGPSRPPQAEKKKAGLPERRYGKIFPFVYRGMGMGRKGGKPFG